MAYDKSLDQVLKVVKVKGQDEGFNIEVRSYNGGEARIKLTRYYRASRDGVTKKGVSYKAGDFLKDATDYPRLSFRLFRWLMENKGGLDAAFEEWERSRKQKGSHQQSSGEDKF